MAEPSNQLTSNPTKMASKIIALTLLTVSLAAAQTAGRPVDEAIVKKCAPVMHQVLWDAGLFKTPDEISEDEVKNIDITFTDYVTKLQASKQSCDHAEALLQICAGQTAGDASGERQCICGGFTDNEGSGLFKFPKKNEWFDLENECGQCYEDAGNVDMRKYDLTLEYLKRELCKEGQQKTYQGVFKDADAWADAEIKAGRGGEVEEKKGAAGRTEVAGGAIAAMIGAALLL